MSSGKRIAAFVALTAAFTAPFWWYITQHRGAPAIADAGYGLMWGPAFAALVVARPLSSLGLGWPARRDLGLGWLIPIGYTAVAYAVVWIAGAGRFAGADEVAGARDYYQLGAGVPGAAVVALVVVAGATLQVLTNAALALGEELGWRGYLVPALVPRFGVRGAGLISGAVWAAWHYPLFFLGPHARGGPPLAYELGCFTVMVLGAGVILAWLRTRSASVWPAVIFHASHNAFTSTCDSLTGDTGSTRWWTSETGAALAIAALAVAIYVAVAISRGSRARYS